jgi:uncharacterized protein YbgA (DUF1722 family)/uncharacterized protein YbbK (DUF523 family)
LYHVVVGSTTPGNDRWPTLRVGVSACLLGQTVRYDGGHKHDRFVTDELGRFVELVPVCPEVELGLGVPRETLRLEGPVEAPRLISRSGIDRTPAMQAWAKVRLEALAGLELDGYVLKKGSPSCGLFRVPVHGERGGAPARQGRGIFTAALAARLPLLPVEEEGRLCDAALRENFIERLFAHARLRTELLSAEAPSAGDLVRFHTRHKMTLLSHHEPTYRELGRLVATAGQKRSTAARRQLAGSYADLFMRALGHRATTARHTNVLQHLVGFFRQHLDPGDRAELLERIEAYRHSLVPLLVPLTLISHHLRRHPVDWVLEQTYLAPYPAELMLRNRV